MLCGTSWGSAQRTINNPSKVTRVLGRQPFEDHCHVSWRAADISKTKTAGTRLTIVEESERVLVRRECRGVVDDVLLGVVIEGTRLRFCRIVIYDHEIVVDV